MRSTSRSRAASVRRRGGRTPPLPSTWCSFREAPMSQTRRAFLKCTAATSLLLASSDLVGELIAQSPKGNPLTSQFKGLSDIALGEAKKIGCSYADVRFTRSVSSGVNASGGSDRNADGGGFGGGRGGRGGRGGGARAGGRPGAAGFGVRVI